MGKGVVLNKSNNKSLSFALFFVVTLQFIHFFFVILISDCIISVVSYIFP